MNSCVYRFLNKDDEIIYIGKTKSLKNRISSHGHLPKECYDSIDRIEYITLDNSDEMGIYERYLINKHNPKYNKEFNNNSRFCFELPDKEWKVYDSSNYKENTIKNINIVSEYPKGLSDADLGKLYKLISMVDTNNGVILSKKDPRSNPMNKKDMAVFLDIGVKTTERYIKRLVDLEILKLVKYRNKKSFLISCDYIDKQTTEGIEYE